MKQRGHILKKYIENILKKYILKIQNTRNVGHYIYTHYEPDQSHSRAKKSQ